MQLKRIKIAIFCSIDFVGSKYADKVISEKYQQIFFGFNKHLELEK